MCDKNAAHDKREYTHILDKNEIFEPKVAHYLFV